MTKEDILKRLKELEQIRSECETMANGVESAFWQILSRTIRAKNSSYRQDSFAAADRSDREIRAFLGRMEALDWLLALVEEDFFEQGERATIEKISLEQQLKEVDTIDTQTQNEIEAPMYQSPGMI